MRLLRALVLTVALLAVVEGAAAPAARVDLRVPDDVRSISYFPARGGWTLMWTRFDPDGINRDFARVASLHANTVRVIVQARTFGYPTPKAEVTARLERVVGLAARHGLRVELTLFDWWHDYGDVAGSRRWAAALLSPYAEDPRIAFVELKNELRPQDEGAAAWAAALIPYVRELTAKPVTVSVPALEPARDLGLLRSALGRSQPDFYSAHFYWRPELADAHLASARAAVAPVPLRVGETGYSTAIPYEILRGVPPSPSAREAQQAYYLRSLALVARRLSLPPIAPWVLSDFAPDAIPPDDPGLRNPREYRFGLFRVAGAAKPAALAIRSIFAGRGSEAFNNGFEQAVRDEHGRSVPAIWRIRRALGASFVRDARVARSGRASARIAGVAGRRTGTEAAFAIAPPDPAVRPGDRSTVTAFARAGVRCGEVRVALRWFASDGQPVGGAQSKPLRCGTRGWKRLRASGTAPSGAAYLGLYLRAARTAEAAWFDDVLYS